ncbi:MAG: MMPL family transporter [Desulfurococcales archaeon]|nr:MMPL family transporter [Desulfurococcales archaeon]
MLEAVIREKPLLVIAAWIIIVLAATPLASQLDSIVETSQEKFLPESAESVRADMELSRIENETGARIVPDYMIVVHGVPVAYDSYKDMKEWYNDTLRQQAPGSLYSWIDVTMNIEAEVRNGLAKGLDNATQLVEGAAQAWKSYNETKGQMAGLAKLVEEADKAYASLYNASLTLQAQTPKLEQAANATLATCSILEAQALAYYDIVRVEALLEYTGAYQRGNLTAGDVAWIVAATNETSRGSVDPMLVYYVYASVAGSGGPQAFNNTLASTLAQSLLAQRLGGEAQRLLEVAGTIWTTTVSRDVDHRAIVFDDGNVTLGQEALLARVLALYNTSLTAIPSAIAQALVPEGDSQARDMIKGIARIIVDSGCSVEPREAVTQALAGVLAEQGLDDQSALKLARSIVSGGVNQTLVAGIVAERVVEEAGLPSGLTGLLARVLVDMDPGAQGTLTGGKALAAATRIAAAMAGIEVSDDALSLVEESGDPRVAAYTLLTAGMPEEYRGLVGELWQRGLLDESLDRMISRLPSVLVEAVAAQANISVDDARSILEAAVRVYSGEQRDAVLEELVDEKMRDLFPEIAGRLRGMMVEEDLGGFLVLYWPVSAGLEESVAEASTVRDLVSSGLSSLGYEPDRVLLGGQDYMHYEAQNAALRDVEKSDRYSIVFVVIVLGLLLESIVAVLLPFLGIGFGLTLALAAVYLLGSHGVIDVTAQSRSIMFSTGLGLGIDYAALVAKRFREEASQGKSPREAAAAAYKRALRPVLAGASAAMIGFGSMILAGDFTFVSSIGANVPIAILMVMAASITFIPALLALVGGRGWFWWPRKPSNNTSRRSGLLKAVARAVTGRPIVPLLLVAALTLGSAMVAAGFEGTYDLALNLPPGAESRQALETMRSYYNPGAIYPAYIVASSPEKALEVNETVAGLECVNASMIVEEAQGRLVQAVLDVDQTSSRGLECASMIREAAHSVDPGSLVGGVSAMNLDLKNLIDTVFYGRVYPVALVLMLAVMTVAYGGIIVALASVLSVSLAALWATALTVLVYEHLYGQEVLWYLPVVAFIAVLGVGMDYNSFYLARAREECTRSCSRSGVEASITLGAGIVLGLAVIMASAYMGLALAETPGLNQMGLALALGVLLAGVNASLLLTPPIIALAGRHAWRPWGVKGSRGGRG